MRVWGVPCYRFGIRRGRRRPLLEAHSRTQVAAAWAQFGSVPGNRRVGIRQLLPTIALLHSTREIKFDRVGH